MKPRRSLGDWRGRNRTATEPTSGKQMSTLSRCGHSAGSGALRRSAPRATGHDEEHHQRSHQPEQHALQARIAARNERTDEAGQRRGPQGRTSCQSSGLIGIDALHHGRCGLSRCRRGAALGRVTVDACRSWCARNAFFTSTLTSLVSPGRTSTSTDSTSRRTRRCPA